MQTPFCISWVSQLIIKTATLPYRRSLRQYTLEPIDKIQKCGDDIQKMLNLIKEWKKIKKDELTAVQLASTFAAAATIAIFSWPSIADSYWLAQALFYTSLMLAIWAIITSVQQAHILDALPTESDPRGRDGKEQLKYVKNVILRYQKSPGLRYYLVVTFIWQFPSMLMSYAWVTLLLALTIHVCSPFIQHEKWGSSKKIAIFYLAVATTCLVVWVLTSQDVHEAEKRGAQTDGNQGSTDRTGGAQQQSTDVSSLTTNNSASLVNAARALRAGVDSTLVPHSTQAGQL